MLVLREIKAAYEQTKVLFGVSLDVKIGEAISIVGRNGVGKSTLAKVIAGLLRPTSGNISLNGRDVSKMDASARAHLGLGYIAQGKTVFPTLSVLENIMVATGLTSLRSARTAAEAIVVDQFPIFGKRLKQQAGSLSGGQQRLLELARVLVRDTSLLVLDEPTEGIQPSLVTDLRDRLLRLRVERNMTLVVIEQRLDFAAALTDRAYVMVKGQFREILNPRELAADRSLQHKYLGV